MVVEDFLPLTLGNSDIILGVQWLEKLGAVTTNWKTQVMTFNVDNKLVTLKGDPSLARSRVSLKTIIRSITQERNVFLMQFNHVETLPNSIGPESPAFLQDIVRDYQRVFDWPGGLPPSVKKNIQSL